MFRDFKGSFKPKFTPRDLLHKIYANKTSYALSFRGPWVKTWYDVIDNKKITYTWGRKIIKEEEF